MWTVQGDPKKGYDEGEKGEKRLKSDSKFESTGSFVLRRPGCPDTVVFTVTGDNVQVWWYHDPEADVTSEFLLDETAAVALFAAYEKLGYEAMMAEDD